MATELVYFAHNQCDDKNKQRYAAMLEYRENKTKNNNK